MTCKGICIRHKAQKPVGSGRYALGQRRCQICEIFASTGLDCGVLAVAIDSEQSHEI